jgi:RND superfamily putative drug exporter
LVPPLITVLIRGVALLVTTRAAPLAAGAVGVIVPSELEPLYVALVLGVVTDYVTSSSPRCAPS